MATICAETELALRRERQPEVYREALEAVLRSARQMTRAVDTLVIAAQQETGLARGRADLGVVLTEAADTCSRLAEERTVDLAVDDPGTPLFVGVEADVAARILQPIVENACRHASQKVRLSVRRAGSEIVIGVDDDGPGVAPEDLERIFEPGVRGAPASPDAPRTPGAGLGLALARRLARAASGDVNARASADGGSFVVRLPAG